MRDRAAARVADRQGVGGGVRPQHRQVGARLGHGPHDTASPARLQRGGLAAVRVLRWASCRARWLAGWRDGRTHSLGASGSAGSRASGGIGSNPRLPGARIAAGSSAAPWRASAAGCGGRCPWTVACTWALATDRWWWALGTGLMAAVSHAIALRDPGPGLCRRSPDGGRLGGVPRQHGRLDRRAAATRQRHRHPEQRRRVLPGDARGGPRAPSARSPSRPTSTGAARSAWSSRRRSPSAARPASR